MAQPSCAVRLRVWRGMLNLALISARGLARRGDKPQNPEWISPQRGWEPECPQECARKQRTTLPRVRESASQSRDGRLFVMRRVIAKTVF